jgi:nucleoside-diphosphate-sugar epimerase
LKLLLCGPGYLGQAISREFLAAGWDVLSASLHGGDGSMPCDVSDRLSVKALVPHLRQPDLVIHCASSGRGGADAYRSVYLEGCRNLLHFFPGSPLLFTSSTSVYAQTDGTEVTEESPAEPERETGKILRETEDLVLAHGGLVARLAGIYGPGRSVLLKKFLNGEAVIEETGDRWLNQIHRDDAARALFHLGSSLSNLPSQLFNVSDSRPLTQLECYTGLAKLLDQLIPPSGPRDLSRKRGWTHKRVSNAKLRTTGWEPRFPCFLDAAAEIAQTL